VAVLDLKPDGVSAQDAAAATDIFRSEMAKTGAFDLFEKRQIDSALEGQADCAGTRCAVEAGKLLKAERVVVGECGETPDEYFLRVRVIDVKSGKVVHADETRSESRSEVTRNIKGMVAKIAGLSESK
jgi:hypothetical protein